MCSNDGKWEMLTLSYRQKTYPVLCLKTGRVQNIFGNVSFSQGSLYPGQLSSRRKHWLAGRQLLIVFMFQMTGYMQGQSLYISLTVRKDEILMQNSWPHILYPRFDKKSRRL
jgi:hypothetical protein